MKHGHNSDNSTPLYAITFIQPRFPPPKHSNMERTLCLIKPDAVGQPWIARSLKFPRLIPPELPFIWFYFVGRSCCCCTLALLYQHVFPGRGRPPSAQARGTETGETEMRPRLAADADAVGACRVHALACAALRHTSSRTRCIAQRPNCGACNMSVCALSAG